MKVQVRFFSYFKDLTGCEEIEENVPKGSSLEVLLTKIYSRFPKLEAMRKSTLFAVGVEYQRGDYELKDGDEVSMFPPVQGG